MLGLWYKKIYRKKRRITKDEGFVCQAGGCSVWRLKWKIFPYKENPNYTIQDERGLIRNNYFDRIMKNIMTDFAALMDYCDED